MNLILIITLLKYNLKDSVLFAFISLTNGIEDVKIKGGSAGCETMALNVEIK